MKDEIAIPSAPLRPPKTVMRLARMGSMFPTRLSFLRVLLRDLADNAAAIRRVKWTIDQQGVGHAVYTIRFHGWTYSLFAHAQDLPDDQRTDRVIATAWDTTYVLYDGVPDQDEIKRLCATVPKQEAARFTERDLILSRANKSVRLFSHVVSSLRRGAKPAPEMLRDVGYLMRTTAVYGNGKFGIADRSVYASRPGMGGPFAAEMLTVYLIRHFTHDLAEHLGGGVLDRQVKQHLGIGNATGLGMAPFLVNHPVLLNNWMMARETALARVRGIPRLSPESQNCLSGLYQKATRHLAAWTVSDREAAARIARLRKDWAEVALLFEPPALGQPRALESLMVAMEGASNDVQELAVSVLLEPFGALVDGLADCMADPFGPRATPQSSTDDLRALITTHFRWALAIDFDSADARHLFWYVSACKQEPRLGERFAEPGAEREMPLDIAFQVKSLWRDLPPKSEPLHAFLARHPAHALAVWRCGLAPRYPYAEIQDNLTDHTCRPTDMLRCKLAFFGANSFDPKSDRWMRITLFQGAPLADDLHSGDSGAWLPVMGA